MQGRGPRGTLTNDTTVEEIATELGLPQEVVKAVLFRFVDILIERIANQEEFTLRNVFSVSFSKRRLKVPPSQKSPAGIAQEVETVVPRFSVAPLLKRLVKLQAQELAAQPHAVNRDTWAGAYKWALKEGKGRSVKLSPPASSEQPFTPPYNPLLDDDDE